MNIFAEVAVSAVDGWWPWVFLAAAAVVVVALIVGPPAKETE